MAGSGGRVTVGGHCPLEGDQRELVEDAFGEAGVESLGLGFEDAGGDVDAGVAELLEALAGDAGVGVLHGDDAAGDAGGDEGVGAGRGFAVVAAGLEGDVAGGAGGVVAVGAGVVEGVGFGVGLAEGLVVALAEELAVFNDEGPDHGVGLDVAATPLGEGEGVSHPVFVGVRIVRDGCGQRQECVWCGVAGVESSLS